MCLNCYNLQSEQDHNHNVKTEKIKTSTLQDKNDTLRKVLENPLSVTLNSPLAVPSAAR